MKFMILDEFSNIKSTNVDLVNKKSTFFGNNLFPKKVKSMQKNVFFKKSGKFLKKSKKSQKNHFFPEKSEKSEKNSLKKSVASEFFRKII